jgi:hypothetical protein
MIMFMLFIERRQQYISLCNRERSKLSNRGGYVVKYRRKYIFGPCPPNHDFLPCNDETVDLLLQQKM